MFAGLCLRLREGAGLPLRVGHPSVESGHQKSDTLSMTKQTGVRDGAAVRPHGLVRPVALANLSQQLVLVVAKQTEGQVVLDAAN